MGGVASVVAGVLSYLNKEYKLVIFLMLASSIAIPYLGQNRRCFNKKDPTVGMIAAERATSEVWRTMRRRFLQEKEEAGATDKLIGKYLFEFERLIMLCMSVRWV